jgi:hypothetical protein
MQCPACKLENPPEALRCDCGYDFGSGQMRASYAGPNVAGGAAGQTWLRVCLLAAVSSPGIAGIILFRKNWPIRDEHLFWFAHLAPLSCGFVGWSLYELHRRDGLTASAWLTHAVALGCCLIGTACVVVVYAAILARV